MSSIGYLRGGRRADSPAVGRRETVSRAGHSIKATGRAALTLAALGLVGLGMIALRYWLYWPAIHHPG